MDWGSNYYVYLIWREEKAILARVSQFNGISSCPETLVPLSCIFSIKPNVK